MDEGSRRGERELELHVASQWSWLAGEEGQGVIQKAVTARSKAD